MIDNGLIISVGFLSILAGVAAFGFLTTQMVFMCFGRSKKKREKQKRTTRMMDIEHGSIGVKQKTTNDNLGVSYVKDDNSLKTNSDCFKTGQKEIDCSKQVKQCVLVDGKEMLGKDGSDDKNGCGHVGMVTGNDDAVNCDGDGTLKDDTSMTDDTNASADDGVGETSHIKGRENNNGTDTRDSKDDGTCDGNISTGRNNHGDNKVTAENKGENELNNKDKKSTQEIVIRDGNKRRENAVKLFHENDKTSINESLSIRQNSSGQTSDDSSDVSQCICQQCSQVYIYENFSQEDFGDNHTTHVQKQHIQLKLNVDIYQLGDDRDINYPISQQFSNDEVVDKHSAQNSSLIQTRRSIVFSFVEHSQCNNACNAEQFASCESRHKICGINVGEDVMKGEHLNTGKTGRSTDGKFTENESSLQRKISGRKASKNDIAVQVHEEDSIVGYNNQDSLPTHRAITGESSRKCSSNSCCCSKEYGYGKEMKSILSGEYSKTMAIFETTIHSRNLTEFKSVKYALEHRINMDNIETELQSGNATNSSGIIWRFLCTIMDFAERCISALDTEKQTTE